MAADIDTINTIMTTMNASAMSMKNNLIGEGGDLLLVLTFCMITYHLALALLGNDWAETQVSIFQTMLKWAIVTVMLTGWNSIIVDTFANKFNQIATVATGNTTSIATTADLGFKTIKSIFTSKKSAYEEPICTPSGANDQGAVFCVEDPNTSPINSDVGAAGAIERMIAGLYGFLFKLVAAIFVMLMMVAFLAVSYIGLFMLGVGATVGPILIPFLVLPAMSYLFDGWMKFMITGGLIKVIAAIVIAMIGVIFAELSSLAVDLNDLSASGVGFLTGAVMCMIAAVGSNVMWQVPEFASQLISGGGGAKAQGLVSNSVAQMKSLMPPRGKK
jgi:type IV secretory pathway VirB6-like protein